MAKLRIQKNSRVKLRRKFSINYKLHCVHQYEVTKNLRKTARANGLARSTLRNWVKFKRFLENVVDKCKSNI